MLLALAFLACGGSGEPARSEGDDLQGASANVDFEVTTLAATPNPLLLDQLLTVNAVIHNTGANASGTFGVQAFLRRGANCDDSSYFISSASLSIAAGDSQPFQVSRVMSNVPGVGTYYLCLVLDPLDAVEESDESNNLVGGVDFPVHLVNCLNDAGCDDDNPCTDDHCEATVGCQHTPNTAPCEDGRFCTVNDVCAGGFCQSGSVRECADPDLCDGTLYCDEVEDACVNGNPPPPCDDGDRCNGVETCNPSDGLCIAGAPSACDLLLNNGGAPPASANVIDDFTYDEDSDERVYLRDLGCPVFGDPDSFCPAGGSPTILEVASGARVGDLEVFDDSILRVSGGTVLELAAGQNATVELSGGSVEHAESYATTRVTGGIHEHLVLRGDATMTEGSVEDLELDSAIVGTAGEMSGGHATTLFAGSNATLAGGRVSLLCARGATAVIRGSGFDANDGRFGSLPGSAGFVSGLLASGEILDAAYHQEGSSCYHPEEGTFETSGQFILLPPASTFIANGLAPDDPRNVIDAEDAATQFHDVYVRNAGCPDNWPDAYRDDPCSGMGTPTRVVVDTGALIPGRLRVLDDSSVSIRGGQVADLRTSAGARIEIQGDGFRVDGVAVPAGELLAQQGVITGTLASGEALVASFDREDPDAPGLYGVIELREAVDLAAGTGVSASLFGGITVAGGVEATLDVATPGTLSGSHETVALEDISTVVPDFIGLAIAARSFQDQYEIWKLEFSGELIENGGSIVRLAYDPARVAPGQQLLVFAWDGVGWVKLTENVVIDPVAHTISIPIDSFSIFALIVREYMVPALSLLASIALVVVLVSSGLLSARGSARARFGRSGV